MKWTDKNLHSLDQYLCDNIFILLNVKWLTTNSKCLTTNGENSTNVTKLYVFTIVIPNNLCNIEVDVKKLSEIREEVHNNIILSDGPFLKNQWKQDVKNDIFIKNVMKSSYIIITFWNPNYITETAMDCLFVHFLLS